MYKMKVKKTFIFLFRSGKNSGKSIKVKSLYITETSNIKAFYLLDI